MINNNLTRLKSIVGLLSVVIVAMALVSAGHANPNTASEFIDDLGQQAIEKIADKSQSRPDREQEFERLFESSFAVKGIARTILGRRWNSISDEEKSRYVALFKEYTVKTYVSQFELFSDQKFEIKGELDKGKKGIVVNMLVTDNSNPPVKVDWRVKQSKKTSRYYIIDIVIEGVSMVITKRAEFASMMDQAGGDFDKFLQTLTKLIEKNSRA
jgi:phospholipid transport system substrate-binding protein